jgi:hypothetical protein
MKPIGNVVDLPRAPHVPPSVLGFKADLCSSALVQAKRLVQRRAFGSLSGRLLSRACAFLDEIDEILVGLDPCRDCDAFARTATLHRELEHIQSLIPSEYRGLRHASVRVGITAYPLRP